MQYEFVEQKMVDLVVFLKEFHLTTTKVRALTSLNARTRRAQCQEKVYENISTIYSV